MRAAIKPGGTSSTGFTLVPSAESGIHWTNRLSVNRYRERQNLMNGAGVALGDFDGDGWCDIYLCNKEGSNGLYRNLGNWRFENVTDRAGVGCAEQSSTGATFADLNGDGRLDLVVTSFTGPNACLLNLGQGRFTNVTAAAGLSLKGGSTSLACGDIDGDGDLDLYVNNFGVEAILRDGGAFSTRTVNGKPVVTGRYARRLAIVEGRLVEFGEPDVLYRNDGTAHFSTVEWRTTFRDEQGQPMNAPWDFGLAVQIRDINDDGFADIYVCNDFQTPDRLWLNDGKGGFRAISRLALRNMSYASMGADFADLDRDGSHDFLAVEMLSREHSRHLKQMSPLTAFPRRVGLIDDREEVARNTLYWNRGDGTYAEIGYYSGLAASDWSWTPLFLDVDLDGFEDVLISNGHLHDVNDRDVAASRRQAAAIPTQGTKDVLLMYPQLDTPNVAFRNNGDLTFTDSSAAWGFDSRAISHGMAAADLDNDGDLDLVVNAINVPPLVYRNETSKPRVAVRLRGRAPNTQGIGAKITLSGGPFPQRQEIICGGRYLSSDDAIRTFAALPPVDPNAGLTLAVHWPSGKRSVVSQVKPNSVYAIEEPAEGPLRLPNARPETSRPEHEVPVLFEDISDSLRHRHADPGFDDFARQPLLPKRLSQLGPGVAWIDLDGDDQDELVVGSGAGGQISAFQRKDAHSWAAMPFEQRALLSDDATGMAAGVGPKGEPVLFVGQANYESGQTNASVVFQLGLDGGKIRQESAARIDGPSSLGPLAVADIDQDGDLDLFAGGRVVPGRFPEPPSSKMFRNEDGRFVIEPHSTKLLEKIGMISAALFSDVDGDGLPDLILAPEWGPISWLRNQSGRLQPAVPIGNGKSGLWNSLASGDFNSDGQIDIVAGNWGLNSFYNRAGTVTCRLFFGEFNQDQRVHVIEAYDHAGKVLPFRGLQTLGTQLPWLTERFSTHKAFAEASLPQILGNRSSNTRELTAESLASVIFWNLGRAQFKSEPLPRQVQWAPALGLNVADADGNGTDDLFVSQNFFALRTEDNRQDAGRGLWLLNDGKGQFREMPGHESGIKVYGEQRGSAVGDFDADGRVDLVVTQNGAETKLFRNNGAAPGLRVRLRGPKNNPHGLGAAVRLVFGESMGPLREIQSGSGYWSQNGLTQVFGTPSKPTLVWVRWPGGKITRTPVPAGATELTIPAEP